LIIKIKIKIFLKLKLFYFSELIKPCDGKQDLGPLRKSDEGVEAANPNFIQHCWVDIL
jgi:hypothetical protein